MGRVGIYLKDKIEREVRDIVQQDLQNGVRWRSKHISHLQRINQAWTSGL
jgi:hypothetical protein